MLLNIKNKLEDSHRDIILAEDLMNENNEFYNLTLGKALSEILGKETLECCDYTVNISQDGPKRVTKFYGWTKTKVIFLNQGLFVHDAILDSVPRNP